MDFIDRLTEILENGLEVHAELVGYVFQLHVILKAKPKDCEVRFLKMVLGIVANSRNWLVMDFFLMRLIQPLRTAVIK